MILVMHSKIKYSNYSINVFGSSDFIPFTGTENSTIFTPIFFIFVMGSGLLILGSWLLILGRGVLILGSGLLILGRGVLILVCLFFYCSHKKHNTHSDKSLRQINVIRRVTRTRYCNQRNPAIKAI
jgi:hypothetical protein